MKICILCDLHLPYHKDAIQYDVLRWAVEDMRKKQAQALLVPGDFTVHGDIPAAEAFLEAVKPLDIPVILCTGNSEYRNPETKEYFRKLAAPTVNRVDDWTFIALHDGETHLTDEDYAALEAADDHTIVALHHPFRSLPKEHREKLEAWRQAHPEVPVFCGHLHYTEHTGSTHMLTASDPDKVAGEQPGIFYYDTDTKVCEKATYFCPIPADLLSHIGISCYQPEVDIPYATAHKIGCIELRPSVMEMDRARLATLVEAWRSGGGSCLSLHAPNLADDYGNPAAEQVWQDFVELAKDLHANRLTMHIPQVKLAVIEANPACLDSLADFALRWIRELSETCVIGLENMHMTPGERVADRRYGYVPEECIAFVKLLRQKVTEAGLGHTVGMHLDVGHARNNMPLVETYTLSPWYAEVGSETVGYHVHQMLQDHAGLHNHNPIPNWYGPMISYASFFRFWNDGILNHAPVILEVRPTEEDPTPYHVSIEALRREEEKHAFDIHAHTWYSNCGRDNPQDVVDTAFRNGIRLFGICDHNYGIGARKATYLTEMRELAEKNKERLRLLVGIEIATFPHLYDIQDPAEIREYDYCLIEHITNPDSLVGGDLFGFCEKLGVRCGIAHTDMFAYCDLYGYAYEPFFREMAERGIFWEMNVSYDSIHRYNEHGYVRDFVTDPAKQQIIRQAGVPISVGFDGHRREDYDGERVHKMVTFLRENGFVTADTLFDK